MPKKNTFHQKLHNHRLDSIYICLESIVFYNDNVVYEIKGYFGIPSPINVNSPLSNYESLKKDFTTKKCQNFMIVNY